MQYLVIRVAEWASTLLGSSHGLLLGTRLLLGWLSMLLGLLGAVLPLMPGTPFLIIGVFLIGPRDYRIRWVRLHARLLLRWCERRNIPLFSALCGWIRRTEQRTMMLVYSYYYRALRPRLSNA